MLTLAQVQSAMSVPGGIKFADQTAAVRADILAAISNIKDDIFTPAQRAFFVNAWFLPTQANVDAANNALPPSLRIRPYVIGSTLYVSMKILVDAFDPTHALYPMRGALSNIPVQWTTAVADDVLAIQETQRLALGL